HHRGAFPDPAESLRKRLAFSAENARRISQAQSAVLLTDAQGDGLAFEVELEDLAGLDVVLGEEAACKEKNTPDRSKAACEHGALLRTHGHLGSPKPRESLRSSRGLRGTGIIRTAAPTRRGSPNGSSCRRR